VFRLKLMSGITDGLFYMGLLEDSRKYAWNMQIIGEIWVE
jgi:hypothetical protein